MSNSNLFYKNIIFLLVVLGASTMACSLFTQAVGGGGAAGTSSTEPPPTEEPLPVPTEEIIAPPPFGRIAFVSNRDGQRNIYVMTGEGQLATRLTNTDSEDDMPRWSPDGERIAFVSMADDNSDIYVMDADGANLTRLTVDPAKDAAPSWSPDGKRIAFESFRDNNFEIYVMNADGSNKVRLTSNTDGDRGPVWSLDGEWIAFVSDRNGNSDIFLIHPDGSNQTQMTTADTPDTDPVWAPDGRIAFRSWSSSNIADICITVLLSGTIRCITDDQIENGIPAWSTDGKWLAFLSPRGGIPSIDLIDTESADDSRRSLSTDVTPVGSISWSPDNWRLVYQADAGNNDMEIFSIITFTQDNEIVRLTNVTAYDGAPSWK